MRAFVFFKDGSSFVLKREVTTPEHAKATEICLRAEGITLFDKDSKALGVKPVLAHDDIQFFRPCFG